MADPKPLTEAEIIAGTVGERRRDDAPVTLAEYDPRWPALYLREESRIRGALGERVKLLEHVGSKRELARRVWQYVQNYADAKSEVVEAIIARARASRG